MADRLSPSTRMADAADRCVLRVERLRKTFSSLVVLSDISFDVREREIVGVIGPSGSGKSTLLKCIDLLEVPDAGAVEYFGSLRVSVDAGGPVMTTTGDTGGTQPLSEQSALAVRRRVGFVFQAYNLWEDRTVLENLTLAPRVVRNEPFKEATARAEELCRQLWLSDKLNWKVRRLSGGQKQRVAIARALMMKPELLLLDEVTSALDPILTYEVMEAIRFLRKSGLTMVIVTHHIEFAAAICDRVMFLSAGRILQFDTPEQLRSAPSTKEVRLFLEVLESIR